MQRFGIDDVEGEVIGNISYYYTANFITIMHWPWWSRTEKFKIKQHFFWSELSNRREAIEEYKVKNRRESKLGDGTPCIVTLEEIK